MAQRVLPVLVILLNFAGFGHAAESTTAALDSLQSVIAAGEYDRAVSEAQALVAGWESAFGAESLEVAQALDLWAVGMIRAGRAAEPQTLAAIQRAVGNKERLLGPDHLETAVSLYWLGQLHSSLGQIAEAISVQQRVLGIRQRDLGPDHALVGDVHGSLGIAIAMAGRLQEARVHFERSAEILVAAKGADSPEVGGAYTNLATLYDMLGDLPAAEDAITKALVNVEHNLGTEHPTAGAARYSLASILLGMGDLRGALVQFDRCMAIYSANDMSGHPRMASALTARGLVVKALGDFAEAQRSTALAVEIYERAYGTEHHRLGYYLNNLGLAAQSNGDLVTARAAFERGLLITRRELGTDHYRTVFGEYYVARLQADLGELDEAEAALVRCLELLGAELGPEHHRLAPVSGDLARVKEAQGDYGEAAELLDGALATNGARLNPVVAVDLQDRRSRIHLLQGEYLAACEMALRVESAAAEQYRLIVQTMSENAARSFGEARVNGLGVALSALLSHETDPGLVALVWDQVIRSRGMLLDELIVRRRLGTMLDDPETVRLAAEVFRTRSRLADLYVRGPGDRSAADFAAVLAQARLAKRESESDLARRSATFRSAAEDRTLGLDAVRDALPADAALVAYQRFERRTSGGTEAWYGAFVLAAGEVLVVDLGAAAPVDDLLAEWRSGMAESWAPGGVLAEAGIAANRELGARLRDLVWTPCEPHLASAATVYIVPDGDLHLLPLAALPAAAGGYLLESGPTFHTLSREKSLVRTPVPAGTGVLAVGDPAFDDHLAQPVLASAAVPLSPDLQGVLRSTPPDCERLREMRFGALPGTRRECETVRALAPGSARVLLGAEATEAAFKSGLGGYRIVHLATHGYFVGADCPAEMEGFAGDPLLLSGLALAGANRRTAAAAGQEDGLLTAEEISLLDLAGVEWVVLSACDTGLGVLQPGEGVHGLQRAFETAGAGTVVMSLWPVEDEVTRQWMAALYQARLAEGLATPAALRQASLAVLAQRRAAGLSEHPFWWAGFVAAGDWR